MAFLAVFVLAILVLVSLLCGARSGGGHGCSLERCLGTGASGGEATNAERLPPLLLLLHRIPARPVARRPWVTCV
jgi:hypothetical protein